ncbi:MAG: ATPase, T2SS/T4P/T4SS family [Acidimicrobiales bacterium]
MTSTDDGRVGSDSADRPVPLGAHLIATGLATAAQIDAALDEQRRTGRRLGEILTAHGVLYEADLAGALATLFDLPYRDLSEDPPDPAALGRLPEAFCRTRGVLPVGFDGDALEVAVSDPRDIQTLDDLKMLSAQPLRVVVVAPDQLRQEMARGFQKLDLLAEADEASGDRVEHARAGDHAAGGGTPNADVSPDLDLAETEGPVITFVNQLLRRAVDDGASDLHLEPTKDGLRIRFRVDGILHDVTTAPSSLQAGILSRVKIMTGMDIADHRRPQDGRVSMVTHGLSVDIRAASLPTMYGEAVVLRLLQKDQGLLDIAKLGFLPDALHRFQSSIRKAWGMVLVTGPTGSGKTTTLFATVNELNVPSRNTITVEDPIEYRVAGIKQTQVNPKVGYTFASGLRAALRSDPDIILIGEIRDLETARIAAESALTGHLVLSTLHANDAASSITRLSDMGLESYLITSSLECVVAQRLLRRLCDRCKVAEAADPEEVLELVSMGLVGDASAEVTVFRPVGCAECGRRGYQGRLAVHEVLVMDDEIKRLVLERAPAHVIGRAATEGGMATLLQDGFAKVGLGETSLDECKRVLR